MKPETSPGAVNLSEADRKLFQTLDLFDLGTLAAVEKKIDLLTMRQLYRLKLALLRISKENECFSKALETGIMKNDTHSYSEAVFSLVEKNAI
ncbi:MAG: hypothetical protein OK457_05300 [Thaumarchaeota archaeon]|nr:hypothetical protein [Nitrososphaerota archaeon]